jgi:hypothetical protein
VFHNTMTAMQVGQNMVVFASAFSHAKLHNQKEFVLHRHLVPQNFYYCRRHHLGNIKQAKNDRV